MTREQGKQEKQQEKFCTFPPKNLHHAKKRNNPKLRLEGKKKIIKEENQDNPVPKNTQHHSQGKRNSKPSMILFNHQDFPVFLEFLVHETLFPGGAGNGFPWEEEEEEDLNLSQLQGDDLGFFRMFSRAPTPSGPSGKCQSQFPGPINPRTKVDPNPVPGEPPGPSLSGTEFPIGKKPLNQP